jgi:predicted dehydrogenase/threonine dehydrogenase-like Zn-dependent dehydrogenase
VEVPQPSVGPSQILVATTHSVISAGTEKAVRNLASASLLAKARARPELVRQVIRKAKVDGIGATLKGVQSRLDEEMPLGYSGAGLVVQVGSAVSNIQVGDRVATAGAGHSELQLVSSNLAAKIPGDVESEDAAFATLASIALHGLRLADLGPGASVCIVGLGLLGQIASRIALASGYRVAGIDLRKDLVDLASREGVFACVETGETTSQAIVDWSRGRGVDSVLITAATRTSEPLRRSPAICRDAARIVLVGDVAMDLERTPLYEKELSIFLARSYGPGRYDRTYEEWGVDYPVGHVRWTAARNLEAVLDFLHAGRIRFADLITHRFPIEAAEQAYALLDSDEPFLGVQLTYGSEPGSRSTRVVEVGQRRSGGDGVGLVGAGSFARGTLVPALKAAGFNNLVSVASQSGLTARRLAERAGFATVADSIETMIADESIDIVVVCTPHDSHAALAAQALRGGKHVFCEKPLALSEEDLDEVIDAWRSGQTQLMVGFNRRYSPFVEAARAALSVGSGPLMMTYRISAGALPPKHWYHDRVQGGRLLGEVCHFLDTCNAIADSPVESVLARAGGGEELLLANDIALLVQYGNGSVASISYSSGGHPATEKERFEVLGRGHTVVIDDYRSMTIDGKVRKGQAQAQDKGHQAELEFFRRSVRLNDRGVDHTKQAIETMRACFAAVQSLETGLPAAPRRDLFE